MAETDLIVDFIGEVHHVAEGDVLTFGRAADLVVDDANDRTGPATATFGHVPLTDEESQLLVALCRPVLLDPTAGPDSLAANRELARDLDWSTPKFNRKLDYLCTRLTKVGVRGLQGGRGSEAVNRRWRLVEHAVSSRMITADDL